LLRCSPPKGNGHLITYPKSMSSEFHFLCPNPPLPPHYEIWKALLNHGMKSSNRRPQI